MLWGGSITGAALAFATQAMLGRHLGPQEYGVFSNALAQTILLSQLAGFGLQTFWLNVFGSEGWNAQRWIDGSLRFLAFSCTLTVLMFLIWIIFGPNDRSSQLALVLMLPAILGFAAIELTASKLQLEERFLSISIWQISHHTARLIVIFGLFTIFPNGDQLVLASTGYALVAFPLIILTIQEISNMRTRRFLLRGHEITHDGTSRLKHPTAFQVSKESWAFGLDAFLYLAYFQCSNILLKYLAGDEASGQFFAAFTIMNAIYLLPIVFYTKFLLSKINRWASHDKPKLLKVFKAGAFSMLIAGTMCTVLVWFGGTFLVSRIYGDHFQNAIPVLLVLALCAPIRFLSTAIGSVLTTGNNMRIRVYIKTVCVPACLILNIVFISRYGAQGAAIATVATELLLLAMFTAAIIFRFQKIFNDQPAAIIN